MNRRKLMTGAAAMALVAATPAVAGHVAEISKRKQWSGPRKYLGPGWYLFRTQNAAEPSSYVRFVEIEQGAPPRFVTIREAKDGPVEWYMAAHVFERTCFAKWKPIDDEGRVD